MSEKEMSRYVARLSMEGTKGLGVVVAGHILTCARYFPRFCVDQLGVFKVSGRIPGQDPLKYYVQTLDAMMDFMVLGDNPLYVKADDGDESPVWGMDPDIRPVEIVFPEEADHAYVPVYFFDADGETPIHAAAELFRWGHLIRISGRCEPLNSGCLGGPVFTADHRLIGIIQGCCHDNGGMLSVLALRIDLAATGWLRQEIGGFETIVMKDAAERREPGCVRQSLRATAEGRRLFIAEVD